MRCIAVRVDCNSIARRRPLEKPRFIDGAFRCRTEQGGYRLRSIVGKRRLAWTRPAHQREDEGASHRRASFRNRHAVEPPSVVSGPVDCLRIPYRRALRHPQVVAKREEAASPAESPKPTRYGDERSTVPRTVASRRAALPIPLSPLNAHGAYLELRHAGHVVEGRDGQPVAVSVLEVEGHPRFPRVRLARHARLRLD